MEILEVIIFIIAYTVGIITIFLELVCYRKGIEYIETIFFTVSFLLLVFSLSIASFLDFFNYFDSDKLNIIVKIPMVLLGLTTPLNIFIERQIKISTYIKAALYAISVILILMLVVNLVFEKLLFADNLASTFLIVSVFSSMLLIRNSKPRHRVKHREKIERLMAISILIFLPITIFIEYFFDKIPFFKSNNTEITLTLPVLFIVLAISKLLDDLKRLSLFKTDYSVKQQNIINYNLTQRELEISELLIKGNSYIKICDSLFISMPTVKTHVSNIYKKVNVNNKMELFNALTN